MPDAAHVDAAAPSKAEIAEMERKVAQAWKDVPDTNIDVGLYKRKREEYRKLNAKLRDMRKRVGVEGPQFYTGDSAPTTVDKLIAAADGLYHRSDAMQNGNWSEQCEDAGDELVSTINGNKVYKARKPRPHYWVNDPSRPSSVDRAFGTQKQAEAYARGDSMADAENDPYRTYYERGYADMKAGKRNSGAVPQQYKLVYGSGRYDCVRGKPSRYGAKADATGCTFILVDGSVDQVIQHQGNYKAIIEREVKDLKKMDVGRVTTKVFENEAQGYAKYDSARGDAPYEHKYNPEGVNQAIAAQNRSGRGKIGGREGKMIHALLKGNEGYASRKDADRPEAHIKHKGVMIDTSFKKDGTVDYYVVEGSSGRFHTLSAAKEVAEGKSRKDAQITSGKQSASKPGDKVTQEWNGKQWKTVDPKTPAKGPRQTQTWTGERWDSVADSKPTSLDSLLSVADELYARSDAVARGDADLKTFLLTVERPGKPEKKTVEAETGSEALSRSGIWSPFPPKKLGVVGERVSRGGKVIKIYKFEVSGVPAGKPEALRIKAKDEPSAIEEAKRKGYHVMMSRRVDSAVSDDAGGLEIDKGPSSWEKPFQVYDPKAGKYLTAFATRQEAQQYIRSRKDEAIEGTADGESIKPGDQVTIKKDVFERMRTAGYNGPRVVRVKEYRGGDVVFTNGGKAKAAEVDCG